MNPATGDIVRETEKPGRPQCQGTGSAAAWFGRLAARKSMKMNPPALFVLAAMLLGGCARPEDDSFGVQAARRGEDCNAIATGSAMDAYGHGVGPAEAVYEDVKRDCRAWYRREAERLEAARRK